MKLFAKKKKKELTREKMLGKLKKIPDEIFTFHILHFIPLKEINKIICVINSQFQNFSNSDPFWNIICNKYFFLKYCKNLLQKKKKKFPDMSYKEYFRRVYFSGVFHKDSLKQHKTSKHGLYVEKLKLGFVAKRQKRNLGLSKYLLYTERYYEKESAFFRFKLLSHQISSSYFAVGILPEKAKSPPEMFLKYHSDGSTSLIDKRLKMLNRVKDITLDSGETKPLKVYYPFEKDIVVNCFWDYEKKKVVFYFEDREKEEIVIDVPKELFDKKIVFVLSLNYKQQIEVLPNVKIEWKYLIPKKKVNYYTLN